MDKLKEIEEKKDKAHKKYGKGLKKIISGVAIIAATAALLLVYPSIPAIVALDKVFATIAGGIISPLIVGGIGTFGVVKTIMGGIKTFRAKRELSRIRKEEKSQMQELEKQKDPEVLEEPKKTELTQLGVSRPRDFGNERFEKNREMLKDVYRVFNELLSSELSDGEVSLLLKMKNYENDKIKYVDGQNGMPMALAFNENAFLGIVTPVGRFEYRTGGLLKREYVDGLIERARMLFGATEDQNQKEQFTSFAWDNPKVLTLKKLPWKEENIPDFVVANSAEETLSKEQIQQIYNDWNAHLELASQPKTR